MKRGKREYRVIIDDESRLERVASWRLTPWRIVAVSLLALLICCWLGVLLVAVTPLQRLLPGYLQESQRAATEEMLLRLDSLQAAYAQNEAFLNNMAAVFDTERIPTDSLATLRPVNALTADSLLGASRAETAFVSNMREREKYNIGIVAPLAAEAMMFYPVSDEGIVTNASRHSQVARIVVARGGVIGAIADGSVLDVGFSPSEGYTMVLQHPKGFVSRYSGLGSPLAGAGDFVNAGQALALSSDATAPPVISLQLWHNGDRLIPYDYISGDGSSSKVPEPEEP